MVIHFQPKTIICIGNGSIFADREAENIAQKNNLKHHGFLDNKTKISSGCYHTSIYDIKLLELSNKIKSIADCKIVVLDHDETDYKNTNEYYETLEMCQAMASHCEVEYVNSKMFSSVRQLLIQNKSFCILPFVSLNHPARHCCWMPKFDNYTNFYTDHNSVKMREQMLRGEKSPMCKPCHDMEDYGGISPRQIHTKNMANSLNIKSLDDVSKHTQLIRYEIHVGNHCNLQCRMCDPKSSNLIDNEYAELGLSKNKIGLRLTTDLDIVDLNTVESLHVAGGEPSINQNFYSFLRKCISQDKTDFEIYISTNAVSMPKEFISLIKNFSKIKISISVDGFDKVNQYIRWPTDWEKFQQNVKKLTEVLPAFHYTFNSVLSIYNISQLYSLIEFLETNHPTSSFNITPLTEPSIQQPWNFPNKEVALHNLNKIKTLRKYHDDEVFQSKINAIIQRMETSEINLGTLSDFFKFNDILDQSRNTKLINYIPELEQCRSYLSNTKC
jgi:molybdenum cofactor biosynthesis enzyme MoaA